MIKLGMLDFDTSHVVQFAKRINRRGIEEDQFIGTCFARSSSFLKPESRM